LFHVIKNVIIRNVEF